MSQVTLWGCRSPPIEHRPCASPEKSYQGARRPSARKARCLVNNPCRGRAKRRSQGAKGALARIRRACPGAGRAAGAVCPSDPFIGFPCGNCRSPRQERRYTRAPASAPLSAPRVHIAPLLGKAQPKTPGALGSAERELPPPVPRGGAQVPAR